MVGRARARPGRRHRARRLVAELAAIAVRFAPSDGPAKVDLLGRLGASSIRDPHTLLRLHETLCYLQAYPDDGQVLAAVNRALEELPARVKRLGAAARRL